MSLIDKTVEVRRGGSYLTIPVEAIDRYLAKGYDVVDSDGNVLKESVPNDINSLKVAYEQHKAKIKELEATVLELKRELRAKADVKPESADVEVKPAKRASKKS